MKRLKIQHLLAGVSVLVSALAGSAYAQNSAAALTGKISSEAEGAMEGVIVSAQRNGSPITVSVVTNDKGEYRFPQDRLQAGTYKITIRAAGYDLSAAATISLNGQTPTQKDLKLVKTSDLASQLSNAE